MVLPPPAAACSHFFFVCTGAQLPAYNLLKRHVSDAEQMGVYTLDAHSPLTHTLCSLLSAGVSILACNPADVVRTRIYNQPFDAAGELSAERNLQACIVLLVFVVHGIAEVPLQQLSLPLSLSLSLSLSLPLPAPL